MLGKVVNLAVILLDEILSWLTDSPFVRSLGTSISWPGESPGGLPKGMLNDSSFGII